MHADQTLTLGMTARLVGRSKTTLCRAIQAGKLPAEKREDGSYAIKAKDAATVYAAYAARPVRISDQIVSLPLFSQETDNLDMPRFLAQIAKESSQNKILKAALEELLEVHVALCRVAGFSNIEVRKEIIAARTALGETKK